jgi:hypothetical protein
MNTHQLLFNHRYDDVISDCRRILEQKPDDPASMEGMARALRARAQYTESLAFFERLSIQRSRNDAANRVVPGSFPWNIDIACLHWMLGNESKAMQMMRGMVAGVLDGAVGYGDAAGGITQGLLLYYMGVSIDRRPEVAFALDYMRNRVDRSVSRVWPAPVAQHYLGDITFEQLLEAANRRANLAVEVEAWKIDLGRRRRVTVALFHNGIRGRAHGDNEHCLARMRQCRELENPLLEQEWYLARYESGRAERA